MYTETTGRLCIFWNLYATSFFFSPSPFLYFTYNFSVLLFSFVPLFMSISKLINSKLTVSHPYDCQLLSSHSSTPPQSGCLPSHHISLNKWTIQQTIQMKSRLIPHHTHLLYQIRSTNFVSFWFAGLTGPKIIYTEQMWAGTVMPPGIRSCNLADVSKYLG